jgi:hypothetical protein
MKPIVFESNPSFWFETLRSFSHPATAELQQRTGQRPLGAAAALAVRLWLLHVQSPPPARLSQRLGMATRRPRRCSCRRPCVAGGFQRLATIYPILSGAGGTTCHGQCGATGIRSCFGWRQHPSGPLTDGFGALPAVVVGLAALTLAMLAVSATTALSAGWPILVALAAWGLAAGLSRPGQQHHLIALAPDETSVVLGLNSSAICAVPPSEVLDGLALPGGTALVPAAPAGLTACAFVCLAVQHHVARATCPLLTARW